MWKTERSRHDATAALATSRGVIEAAVAHLLGGRVRARPYCSAPRRDPQDDATVRRQAGRPGVLDGQDDVRDSGDARCDRRDRLVSALARSTRGGSGGGPPAGADGMPSCGGGAARRGSGRHQRRAGNACAGFGVDEPAIASAWPSGSRVPVASSVTGVPTTASIRIGRTTWLAVHDDLRVVIRVSAGPTTVHVIRAAKSC